MKYNVHRVELCIELTRSVAQRTHCVGNLQNCWKYLKKLWKLTAAIRFAMYWDVSNKINERTCIIFLPALTHCLEAVVRELHEMKQISVWFTFYFLHNVLGTCDVDERTSWVLTD